MQTGSGRFGLNDRLANNVCLLILWCTCLCNSKNYAQLADCNDLRWSNAVLPMTRQRCIGQTSHTSWQPGSSYVFGVQGAIKRAMPHRLSYTSSGGTTNLRCHLAVIIRRVSHNYVGSSKVSQRRRFLLTKLNKLEIFQRSNAAKATTTTKDFRPCMYRVSHQYDLRYHV